MFKAKYLKTYFMQSIELLIFFCEPQYILKFRSNLIVSTRFSGSGRRMTTLLIVGLDIYCLLQLTLTMILAINRCNNNERWNEFSTLIKKKYLHGRNGSTCLNTKASVITFTPAF